MYFLSGLEACVSIVRLLLPMGQKFYALHAKKFYALQKNVCPSCKKIECPSKSYMPFIQKIVCPSKIDNAFRKATCRLKRCMPFKKNTFSSKSIFPSKIICTPKGLVVCLSRSYMLSKKLCPRRCYIPLKKLYALK